MARADYPEPVVELIAELKRLPGIGPRSAERVAVWLLQNPKSNAAELAEATLKAKHEVDSCDVCGFFSSHGRCPVCSDEHRDASELCVVEQATDVLPLERSGVFKGYYHCMGGKLSPLDNVTPENLRITPLIKRVEANPGVEVILALGADVEGEATANYLAEVLSTRECRVTRIAQGLPAGGGLDHADELTLMRALQGRRQIEH
ncbi:MAG: recombination mediator RecR [Akkermansiaceae bacterium]|nr:recombination mediator RecR [Akkermansiaceae bacterium]